MKKNLIALMLCLIISRAFCQSPDSTFNLTGHINGLEKGIIYLKFRPDTATLITDSAKIVNGDFVFRVKISQTVYALFTLTNAPRATQAVFFMDPANAKVEFSSNPFAVTKVEGSKTQDELVEWRANDKALRKKFSDIQNVDIQNVKDTTRQKMLLDSLAMYKHEKFAADVNFISKYPQSDFIPYIIMIGYREYTHQQLMDMYNNMSSKLQASPAGRQVIRALMLNYTVVAKDTLAPAIIARDYINNKDFNLAALKGKYVLMDFWGSWCAPCIAMLPTIAEEYKKYAGKNIVFVSVAHDFNANQNKCKAIVAKNGMTWVNLWQTMDVQDPASIMSKYHVEQFPTIILIDPAGKIIEKADDVPGYVKYREILEKAL